MSAVIASVIATLIPIALAAVVVLLLAGFDEE